MTLALLVTRRLEWAGVAAGLAASAKYPGVVLAVPLVVAGFGEWRRLGTRGRPRGDRVRGHEPVRPAPRRGCMGRHRAGAAAREVRLARLRGRSSDAARVRRAGLGHARPARARRRRGPCDRRLEADAADLVLLSFVVVYALSLLPDRGALRPLCAPARPGAVRPRGSRPVARDGAVVAALVPLWWSVDDGRALTGHDPRIAAAAWIERNVPPGDRIAVGPVDAAADPPRVVRLELPGPRAPLRRSGATSPPSAARASGGSSWATASAIGCSRPPRPTRAEVRFYRSLATTRNQRSRRGAGRGRRWVRVYRIYP